MLSSIVRNWNAVNRRELFRRGGVLTLLGAARPALASTLAAPTTPAAPVKSFENSGAIYRAIGVRPVVNARGTFTIITGSQTLPSVKEAMDEASRSFVQMDELMEGVGKRLAEVTQAPLGNHHSGLLRRAHPLLQARPLRARIRNACSACPI